MDPFTGAMLIALAIVLSFRSGAQHAREDFRRTREQQLKAAQKGKPPLSPAVRNKLIRQHRTGWWASEIRHGFPVTRTGMHTGWLAHQAAAMHTKAQREAARTTQLDATASFASAVKDHRERQAAIRAEIEQALQDSPVEQDGSRRAVREAAGAVILPFPERRAPEPGPYAPDPGLTDAQRARDADPRLRNACAACGHTATEADPLVIDRLGYRVHSSHTTDPASGLYDPTLPQCSECGLPLRLRDHDGVDHLDCARIAQEGLRRVQRVPAGECTECGDPLDGRPNDGWTHEDCHRVSNAEADACEVRDNRDLEEVEADLLSRARCPWQTGTDGGVTYCGRDVADTGGPYDRQYCLEHQCDAAGDDEGAAQARNDRVKALLAASEVSGHSTATEGVPVSGDTTFSTVKTASTAAIGLADQDVATIRGRKDAAFALADEMQALDVDAAVVSEQMNHAEALAQAEEALVRAGEHATATSAQLDRYHGHMEEATVSAPGSIAAREFHGE